MADVSKIDIDGVQWDIKDAYLRNYVLPENGSLKEYIKKQNNISVTATIQGGTSEATAVTADYDGILTLSGGGQGNYIFRGVELHIKHKNETSWHTLRNGGYIGNNSVHYGTIVVPIFKGDTFYAVECGTIDEYYARYYVLRTIN